MQDINKYAEWVETMWVSKDKDPNISLSIAALGLAGETGEALEHIKKLLRDGTWNREAFIKEMGDNIYYWCKVLNELEIKPSEVLQTNFEKLESRKARNVMRGSGDER